MLRGRISAKTRWVSVVAALGLASAIASVWRADQHAPRAERTVINLVPPIVNLLPPIFNLVPPIFTSSFAQTLEAGCTGSPVGSFGTPAKTGVLAIAMNSLSILDYGEDGIKGDPDGAGPLPNDDPPDVVLLDAPKDLNFAAASGVDVGDFVNKSGIPVGTYEEIKGVMDDQFRILCAVTCDPDGAGALPAGTYLTKGATTPGVAPFDAIGGEAFESSLDITGGKGPQAFNFVLPATSKIEVTPNGIVNKDFAFSATGACELWNLGSGNVQILPAAQSASTPE